MKPEPLFLIDSYGLIYRSYFAFLQRPLRDAQGRNVSAAFGFFRGLLALLDQGIPADRPPDEAGAVPLKPVRLAAVFDPSGPTFRHELYPEYKATRQKTPDDLHAQVPLVEEVLAALGVPILRLDGFEADDLIATLADRCRAEGRACYVVSADKDLLQLVGGGIYQLRPGKGGPDYELVGPRQVKAEWGVEPPKILDLLALTGDASDNVPGVKGVGDKTAVKLMARYGSLDSIYENIAGIEGSVGKRLAADRESAYFSRKLIELRRDAPLGPAGIDSLAVDRLDRPAAAKLLAREGLRQLALAFDPSVAIEPGPPPRSPAVAPAGDALPSQVAAGAVPVGAPGGVGPARTAGNKPGVVGACPCPQADDALKMPGAYRPLLDLAELDALLARAKASGELAIDFETDSLDAWHARPIGLSLAVEPGEAVYVPLAAHAAAPATAAAPGAESAPAAGSGQRFLDPAAVRSRIGAFLADPAMTVVAHNAKYDYEVSRGWGLPRWRCRIWDTLVAAWLLDPERNGYALDSLVGAWLGMGTLAYDAVVPKGATFQAVPLATAVTYAAQDADYALRVRRLLQPCLDQAGLYGLFADVEMPLLPVLAEMEGAGISLEGDVLRAYGAELETDLAGIETQIYKLVGHEFNIASTKQLQEVLFVERKLKPGKKTKTGYSTDVAVLEELAREDPVPERILRYRSLAKLKSTYVDSLPTLTGPDGRLHTHFAQTGTATGRLSSRDPNLQNIPIRDDEGRRIRQAFVAMPGMTLVSADYSQIELVVLAHLSGDPGLCAAFREGKDVHRRTAALIFGVPEEAVRPDQRRIAKTINFGVMYGMSAFRLANELGIGRSEAQTFIDAYFHTYSGIRDFIARTVAETERLGYAVTLLGRRRYIPAINSANKTEKSAAERVAVNTPIQGSAADIVKLAMLGVDRALAGAGLDARLLLQVHDELIFEAAETDSEALMGLVRTVMETTVTLAVPLRASLESHRRWGEMH